VNAWPPVAQPRYRAWRLLLAVAMSLAVLVATPTPAAAHAELLSTNPASGDVVGDAPPTIELRFSEQVDVVDDSVRVVDATGDDIEVGNVSVDSQIVRAAVPALENGTYVVVWRAISADAHPIRGAFTFSVGAPSTTQQGLVDDLLAEPEASGVGRLIRQVGRWSSFVGVAALAGALLVAICIPTLASIARRLAPTGAVGAVIGTVLMIMGQAAETGGRSGDLVSFSRARDVVQSTSGQWWAWRLVVIAVLGSASVVAWRWLTQHPAGIGALGVGLAALAATMTLGGHASTGRATGIGLAATGVHLAAMATWVGAVMVMLMAVRRRHELDDGALTTFGRVATVSVVGLVLSGVVNSWRQVGSLDALRSTRFGELLITKTAIVVVLLAIANLNRRRVRATLASTTTARSAMTRTVGIEIVLMAAVLAITAVLVDTKPARADVSRFASAAATQDGYVAQVVLDPATTGPSTLHVYLSSPAGSLGAPDEITVQAELPEAAIAAIELPVRNAGPNHVQNLALSLPVNGRWTFIITARFGEFDQRTFRVSLNVT
jgi:copper transport protein